MRKKTAGILLAATMLSGTTSFADVESVKLIGDTCVTSGTVQNGESVSVMITKAGAVPVDNDNIISIGWLYNQKAGEFTHSLEMEDEVLNGVDKITVFVRVGENEIKKYDFEYISPKVITELISKLKKASDADEIKSIIDDSDNDKIFERMGRDKKLWNDCDKDNASKIIYSQRESFGDNLKVVSDVFTIAVKLSGFDGDVEEINKLSEVKYGNVKWDDIKGDSKKATWISGYLKDIGIFKDMTAFNAEFGTANVISDINNVSGYAALKTIITDNADLLGIKKQSYYSYYSDNETKVLKALYSIINKDKVKSIDDFNDKMDDAVDNAKNSKSSNSSVSSSSGGGGGGGNRGTGVVVPTGTPTMGNATVPEAVPQQIFTDVSTAHWAVSDISELKEKEIINGYDDGSFRPDSKVTREEFVTMIIKATDTQTLGGSTPFRDVVYGSWYAPYVTTAYRNGMVNGVGVNEFGLGREITRQDATVILSRLITVESEAKTEYTGYNDENLISDYASEPVRKMSELGIIRGSDGIFRPTDSISRAEAAAIICRFMKLQSEEVV